MVALICDASLRIEGRENRGRFQSCHVWKDARETARKLEKSQTIIMYWGFEAKVYSVPFVPPTVAPLYLLG
jgi:hypothetical protein